MPLRCSPKGAPPKRRNLLEKDRVPARSDIEFALGRAYATSGSDCESSRDALANVYYNMPTSAEADAAYAELKKLPSMPPATPAQRKTRAELLMKAKRYNDAVDEYRELASHATPEGRPAAELALADALHRSGRNREAKAELTTLPGATPDQNAQRLYILGEVAWASDENDTFYRTVDELRQTAPTSPWLEQALLSVANLHLVHHEYEQALDTFRELQQRFPNGSARLLRALEGGMAHSCASAATTKPRKNSTNRSGCIPAGNETSAALYWRARLAEEDNQSGMARAYYQKLSDRFRNYYYAELGRERLKKLPQAAPIRRANIRCSITFRRSSMARKSRSKSRRPTICICRKPNCWRTAAL